MAGHLTHRYVIFGAACFAWLAMMILYGDFAALYDAGRAWFTIWGIQMFVATTSWIRPFSLPTRYYEPLVTRYPDWLHRMIGLRHFGLVARRLNPLAFDKRSPRDLEAALGAAETTHAITFAVGTMLVIVAAAASTIAMAAFLALWNVIFNLYPVALQRYNRKRLKDVTSRRARGRRLCDLSLDRHADY